MGITFVHKGNYNKTKKYLNKISGFSPDHILAKYGEIGISALASATPNSSGETANSWYCTIESSGEGSKLVWSNSHTNKGVNIAVILQYGHGTGTGGYVVGRDYINPAIQPIFDEIAEAAWKEVTS